MEHYRRNILIDVEVEAQILRSASRMIDEYHDLELFLTIDLESYLITACEGRMNKHPYRVCPGALDSLKLVIGMRMSPGVKKTLKHTLPKAAGCAHFTEVFENTFDFLMQKLYWDGAGRTIEDRAGHEKLLFGFLNQSDTCFAFNKQTGFSPEASEFLPEHPSERKK